MAETLGTAAVGYALVDQKVFDDAPHMPAATPEAAEEYLAGQDSYLESAGGSVATTVAAYQQYSGYPTRLYYRTADDYRGQVFRRETSRQLGPSQISEGSYTGFCVLAIDEQGEIADEITLYGVGPDVQIPKHELTDAKHSLVISNVNTLRSPNVHDQTTALLENLDPRGGIFAFRLSGAHDLLASTADARAVLESLPRDPDIIFGNVAEVTNLSAHSDYLNALHRTLPNSRVFVLSRGADEILIRFEGDVYRQEAVRVLDPIDVTGAGDHLMGVALGELMQVPYREWSPDSVRHAIAIGSLAASRVIQTTRSRLTRNELMRIKRSTYGAA